jgi:hypothetical protein
VKIIRTNEFDGKKTAVAILANSLPSEEFLEQYYTKDGLIPANKLKQVKISNTSLAFELDGKLVFPDPRIRSIVSYLLSTNYWSNAALRIIGDRLQENRLPIYGVSFSQALEIALRERFSKSLFYVPNPDKYVQNGFLADMVVTLKTQDRKIVELEMWQQCKDLEYVFYVHGLLDEQNKTFSHLDGSIIYYEPFDKQILFKEGKKPKGRKQKYFRVDDCIQFEVAFDLIRLFLPIEELVDEYFEFGVI